MHDRLFANPKPLDAATLVGHARQAGLDLAGFETCMQGDTAERIRADIAEAERFGITGTPTFLIGTRTADGGVKVVRRLAGTHPAAVFRTIIEALLKQGAAGN